MMDDFALTAGGPVRADIAPPGINGEAWADWVAYRKAKRKPVSQIAAGMAFRRLAPLSLAQQAQCIEASISNDWQGLFPERYQRRPEAARQSTRSRSLFEDLTDRSWSL